MRYAEPVPIVIAMPEARPPIAKPTLRSAPRKPNHFSRSPGCEIAATMLPYEPQNAVRPTETTTVHRISPTNESVNR